MRVVLGLVLTLVLAGCLTKSDERPTSSSPTSQATNALRPVWGVPLDLHAVGYEPSIAVDSTGALFITAHKDLQRPDTWPYLASWILASTDHGATWHEPTSPAGVAGYYVGDEGDLAVDGRDWLYYIDTYAADNHLHVWSDQGRTWQYSAPVHTTQADDRPWIAAQGQGIVHYLGNNGVSAPGERYIYYRSTDGGLVFTTGKGLPGTGWAHVAAQSKGPYVFVLQEADAADATDLMVYPSANQGADADYPSNGVKAGARQAGAFDGFPLVATDDDGNPAIVWEDAGGATGGASRLWFSRSHDHGATWTPVDVTPFKAYVDHAVVAGGKNGTVGVAFYATTDLPLSDSSKWYVWAGLGKGTIGGPQDFAFTKIDPQVLYTGKDTHALHDFFEIAIDPQGALNVAYMTNLPPKAPNQTDGDRHLWFVRGTVP